MIVIRKTGELLSRGSKWKTYGANRMDFGECVFRITKATSSEVKEVVALVSEASEVATLIPSFVWGVYGKGSVFFHV